MEIEMFVPFTKEDNLRSAENEFRLRQEGWEEWVWLYLLDWAVWEDVEGSEGYAG